MIKLKTLTSVFIAICLSIYMNAQDIDSSGMKVATGIIYDAATGMAVEGISVSVPGAGSAFTDSNGFFKLNVHDFDCVVKIKGLDYQAKEIPLKGKNNVNIYLYENDYQSYNEYANLYYYQKPLTYTANSVTTLNIKNETWKNPVTSPEEIITGRVAGLRVKTRSGVPGIGANMYLRGYSSIYASNQPLIIVDGQIYVNKQYGISTISGYANNPLASIDVNDIENITIVKDAVSIYGARASNGIIFIQTNHTTRMATKIDFTSYFGVNYSPKKIPLLQADDYRRYLSEILETSGISGDSIQSLPYMIDDVSFGDYYRYHNNTIWQDEIYTGSYNQKYNLKISGGDDIALYSLSVGYMNQNGIVKNTSFSRYTVRFNSDINISTKLTLNANMAFSYNQHNLKDDGLNFKTNPVYLSLFKAPFTYPRLRGYDGSISPILEDADIFGIGNPVAIAENLNAVSNNFKIFGSFNANYQITKNLTLSDLIGVNFDKIRDNLFVPHLGVADDTLDLGIAENTMAHKVERMFMVSNDLRLHYARTFNYRHHFSALMGSRLGVNQLQDDWAEGHNSPNDFLPSIGNGVNDLRSAGGDISTWKWITYYANADYNFKNRYFLSLNMSLDGSSRFGDEAKGLHLLSGTMGLFPSAAVAWIASSEKFLADLNFIELLKLRLSYGITGNDEIGNYVATKYYIEQNFLGLQGIIKGILGNPELQWETNKKLDAGIDMSFLKDRLSVSLDLFNNKTENMINIINANELSGFSTYIDNNGSFVSKGLEFALNSRILNGKLKWDLGMNISTYRTEVTEFPENERITNILGANILTKTGEPIGLFYGYKTLGVFATQEEASNPQLRALLPNTSLMPFSAGDMHFEDLDGNNIIDEDDMQLIGDPNPDFTGWLFNRFEWKGIAVEADIIFSYGNDIYNYLRYELESMQNTNNQSLAVLNRWSGEGQITDIPRAVWADTIGNSRFSDRWIEDGSYIRLKKLTLSYKFPSRLKFVNSLEVFITGENLITFTKYLGMDPEFSMSEFPLSQGIDIGLIPQVKSVSMGFKIGL
jgi:TonB-linked SusC/RagA family outer membrane protein